MRRGLQRPGAGEGDGGEVFTVSSLTRRIRALLASAFSRVAVEGEIGRLTVAGSGHVYFTLKDEGAVLEVVMWRSTVGRRSFPFAEGAKVVARGEIAVYEPRGRYQLVADSVRAVGEGDLYRRFEELKRRLQAEGLFDAAHKVSLPAWPRCVGIVTSPQGAALRDMLRILRRRCPGLRIVLAPCLVQGEGAAAEIATAIARLDRWGGCDVIIAGRGGGSLEDLWAFNEELVARAIFACRTPIVSAVGHETDFTIADLVADMRAATPSEAAERVAPDIGATRQRLQRLHRLLDQAVRSLLSRGKMRLRVLASSSVLRRPGEMIGMRQQRLDDATAGLARAIRRCAEAAQTRRNLAAARLEALSPLAVLRRGYSITRLAASGRILRQASEVICGDQLITRLAEGEIISTVSRA